ncbi:hypothetical protein Ddye_003029, partial [Dipteronia dyeriana]
MVSTIRLNRRLRSGIVSHNRDLSLSHSISLERFVVAVPFAVRGSVYRSRLHSPFATAFWSQSLFRYLQINAFGQSSSSPFGSSSVFGQTNNASNNPFAPKPFGTTTPFGSTGSSIFGGTSTGVFGAAQSSSPFSSATTFGASSSPTFGSSNVPTFGSSSSSFG